MNCALLKFKGYIENYHWGKKGKSSLISGFIRETDNNLPYAELWFGAHRRAPSPLADGSNLNLRQVIEKDPAAILGTEISVKFRNELPFLFKILSIEQPLSIQLHPDKVNAAELHKNNPKNYPDSNHKPEIAVALSEVHVLYGFRPVSEIKKVLRKNPELLMIISPGDLENFSDSLKKNNPREYLHKIYCSILNADRDKYANAAEKMAIRIRDYKKPNRHEKLVLDVISQYGYSDLAVFSVLLMNYGVLQPGQAVYTGPNKLHAYLKGDLIECMSNSDNVIRAGMTPKFQDVKNLERLVDTDMQSFAPLRSNTRKNGLEITSYPVSCEEFELSLISGSGTKKFKNITPRPVLLVPLSGEFIIRAEQAQASIRKGEACLVPASLQDFSINCEECTLAYVSVPV